MNLKRSLNPQKGIIQDLKDTLQVKEASEEALRKQVGDKEYETSNFGTYSHNLRNKTVEDTGVGLTTLEETVVNNEPSFERTIEELESQVAMLPVTCKLPIFENRKN